MSQRTRIFRNHYGSVVVPRGYNGHRHAGVVIGCGLMLIAMPWLLFDLRMSMGLTLLSILGTLVTASVVEYLTHRFVMHRPRPGLRAVYHRHARQHHRYFTRGDFFVESASDLHAALFPAVLLLFFAAITTSLAALVALLFSKPVAAIVFSTSMAYYLVYEIVHLTAHLPDQALWRPGWLRRLNDLHRRHHEPSHVRRANFNIVLPLGDWLFGTLQSGTRTTAMPGDSTDHVALIDSEHLIQAIEKE